MPGDPLRASANTGGQSNWKRDSAGVIIPVGGSNSAKMLMEMPKEVREWALAANVLARGNFDDGLEQELAFLCSLAPGHIKTLQLVINLAGGSMGKGGRASVNFLQGIVQMIAPSALPAGDGHQQLAKIRKRKDGNNGKVATEDGE